MKHIKAKAIGTRYIGSQIVKRILLVKSSMKKVLILDDFSTTNYAANLFSHILKDEKTLNNNFKSCSINELSEFEKQALKEFDKHVQQSTEIYTFSRIKNGNIIYNTSVYEKGHKRCSSCVKWINNGEIQYGIILNFVKHNNTELFIAIKYNILNTIQSLKISKKYKRIFRKSNLQNYFIITSKTDESYVCYPITALEAICMNIQIENENFNIITEVFDYEHG